MPTWIYWQEKETGHCHWLWLHSFLPSFLSYILYFYTHPHRALKFNTHHSWIPVNLTINQQCKSISWYSQMQKPFNFAAACVMPDWISSQMRMGGVPQSRNTGQDLPWREIVRWWSLLCSSQGIQAALMSIPKYGGGRSKARHCGERSSTILLAPGWEGDFPSWDVVLQKTPIWEHSWEGALAKEQGKKSLVKGSTVALWCPLSGAAVLPRCGSSRRGVKKG